MARRIELSQIGNYSLQKYEQLLRATVLETDRRLKEESPVDLGRFRLSWAIGENSASFPGMPPGDYRGTPVSSARRINYSTERAGNVYSIHNNLPYAEKLANASPGAGLNPKEKRYNPYREVPNWAIPGGGSSHQTNGSGWVDLIAREMTAWVRQQADRIGRQD